jgi:hypothetical protein
MLADLKDRITQEKELYKQFNMAYRQVYEVHRGNKLQKELERATVTTPSILKDDVYKSLLQNDNDDDSDTSDRSSGFAKLEFTFVVVLKQ